MNPTNEKIAKAGTLLMFSAGSYSDYGVIGLFVVLSEFKPMAMLEEFWPEAKEKSMRANRQTFDHAEFLAFLLKKGLLLELNYSELFCGDYGDAWGTYGVRFDASESAITP